MVERGSGALRLFDRWLGIPLTVPGWLLRRALKPPPRHAADAHIGIFCPGAIGDLLLLSALTNGIKGCAPKCRLEIIATHANAPALPLIPQVDESHVISINDPLRIAYAMRKARYDVLIDASQWARIGALLCACSGAGLTIGFNSCGQWRSLPYDNAVAHRNDRHEVENFLALGRAIWPNLEGKPAICLRPQKDRDNAIYCHFRASPGRGRGLKEWPQEHWARLISACLAAGYEVYLTGSSDDAGFCNEFIGRYFADANVPSSIAGQMTLTQLAARFQRAQAVISVNTGIMHLAALAGAPTIGLHGATNPVRWGPIGERCISILPNQGQNAYLNLGFEYPANAENSMPFLPVEKVIAALEKLNVPMQPICRPKPL